MPRCKNVKDKFYNETENTPLGKGYHAEGYEVDKKMTGRDGKTYRVVSTSRGKRWNIVKIKNTSPRGIMSNLSGTRPGGYTYRYGRYSIKIIQRENKTILRCVMMGPWPLTKKISIDEIPKNILEKMRKNISNRKKNAKDDIKKINAYNGFLKELGDS